MNLCIHSHQQCKFMTKVNGCSAKFNCPHKPKKEKGNENDTRIARKNEQRIGS